MPRLQEAFIDTTPGEPPVRGHLHQAAEPASDFLVVTHGASGNCNGPLLVGLASQLASAGVSVLRCDLPFRQRKPNGPPSPSDVERDQEGLRRAVTLMKSKFSGRAFLGGSSYGGRQASMLAAGDPALVGGLLLLSYPLHPPGQPTKLRTAHFSSLRVPSLFVSGTRDAFGSIEELQQAIALILARTRLVPVEGASHGFSDKLNRETVPKIITEQVLTFFQVA